jgi:peptidoglycan-N-acetylglucosamine deacetylase
MNDSATKWLATLGLPLLIALNAPGFARAADCPGNPDAIGTSRTLVVDPSEHPRIGAMSYDETLPLKDKEVVLTFDDGPIPPNTARILDTLAAECVKATFFTVGEQIVAHPDLLRREAREGHSIGTHSMTHPYAFRALSVDQAKAQIDDGIAAATAALGDASKVSPFFRFPGFGNTDASEDYLESRGIMAWGADLTADDWTPISERELVHSVMMRLEHQNKGILLLLDIHQRTAAALPILLHELKLGGYHIVHVVAASPEQPKTETSPQDWFVPHRMPTLLLSDMQDLNGDARLLTHPDELCEFKTHEMRTAQNTQNKRHFAMARHFRHFPSPHYYAPRRAAYNHRSWFW